MHRFISILLSTLIILTGCQANLINQTPKQQAGLSSIAYHNEFVEHVNAIIAKAELTINNYKELQLNDTEITIDKLSTDLQILSDQIDNSSTTLTNLQIKNESDKTLYTKPFNNNYLRDLNQYIRAYELWLTETKEIINAETKDKIPNLQSDNLENHYSKFIKSHNDFVKTINGQI